MHRLNKTKKEKVAELLTRLLITYNPGESIHVFNDNTTFSDIINLIEMGHRYNSKRIHFTSIENLYSDMIFPIITRYRFTPRIKKKINITEKMGIYKATLSDGSIMLFAKWISDEKRNEYDSLFAAEENTMIKYLEIKEAEQHRKQKPPTKGIYILHHDHVGDLYYVKTNAAPYYPLVIPCADEVIHDIDHHFANLQSALKYKRPGIRKVLLTGPPGTGKSSFCNQISIKYSKKIVVVKTTSFHELAHHLYKCGKSSIPNIAILEDADESLNQADAKTLNILDGYVTPRNTKGSYVIMTTNYPDKIEPRVKRAGRIDKHIYFGVLEKDLAYKCAQQYFDEIEIDLTQISQNGQYEKFIQIFSGLSGAQIKELAYATGSYMASKQIDTFSLETLNHVKNDMVKSAMKSDELQKNNSLEEPQKIGFGNRVNNFD